MLDSLIQQYESAYSVLAQHLHDADETGVIPNAHIEGAPKTVDEYRQALGAMLFIVDRVLFDLNALRMEALFSRVAEEREQ